ncbi:MAG: aldo/keto reductase [Deltaproteobacteria bacterium]|nr:MAG: aldo/keto reductase [Deltaproteobacteria bacterium]
METRLLGATGVRVSRIALGAMSFGGEADEAASAAIWRAARDAGVNLIDIADVYNEGRSEEIVGRLMRHERDQIVLATKAYFPTGKGVNDRGGSRYHLVRAAEASLRRLATDRIDLFYPACSNFAAWQVAHTLGVQRLHGWAPLVAIQPMYNLVKRQVEVEILPMASSLGLAVIPYSPTGGGLLTGKYGPERKPERGRLLDARMYTVRYADPRYLTIAGQFTALAAELGHPPAALAVAWVASHPGVTSVLVGGRSVEQLAPTLAAGEIALDDATRARITALSPDPPPATDRNEEVTAHNYGAR